MKPRACMLPDVACTSVLRFWLPLPCRHTVVCICCERVRLLRAPQVLVSMVADERGLNSGRCFDCIGAATESPCRRHCSGDPRSAVRDRACGLRDCDCHEEAAAAETDSARSVVPNHSVVSGDIRPSGRLRCSANPAAGNICVPRTVHGL